MSIRRWSPTNIKRATRELRLFLSAYGVDATTGQVWAENGVQHVEITSNDGMRQLARLNFPPGKVGCTANGFYFETDPSELLTVASAIAGNFPPGEPRDWRRYGFSRLECRSH